MHNQNALTIKPSTATQRVRKHFDENVELYVKKVLPCYEESSRERLEQLAETLPDATSSALHMLDIGCGGGAFLDLFLHHFQQADALGIDLSHGMLGENEPCTRKRLRQADALNLPKDIGAFDVINIDTVMHHLIAPGSYGGTLMQIEQFLASMHRCLAPGGVIMIREIYHEYRVLQTLGTRLIFELSTLRTGGPIERLLKAIGIKTANAGVCFLSRNQWMQVFSRAGFSVLAVQQKPWTSQPYRRYGFAASCDIHYIIGRTRPRIH